MGEGGAVGMVRRLIAKGRRRGAEGSECWIQLERWVEDGSRSRDISRFSLSNRPDFFRGST